MSTLMGAQADATEDMFSKLESMRAVITEVNTQFKDPVCVFGGLASFFSLMKSSIILPRCRRRRRSFACAYPNSCHCTRRSGLYKN